MESGLKRQHCVHHPERYGHAVCMSCRKTLCQECATEWDGINYCAGCLARRRASQKAPSSAGGWVLVGAAAVALFLIGPKLLVWGATLLFRGWAN